MSVQTSVTRKDQIRDLLKNTTMTQRQVALAAGCDETYVSQLLSDEEFAEEVATARITLLREQSDRDKKYDSIEDELLKRLETSLEFMMKPDLILRAIQTVNGAKRRGAPADTNNSQIGNTTIINLQLPSVLVNRYSLNAENQIIEADGRILAPMAAQNLMRQIGVSPDEKLIENKRFTSAPKLAAISTKEQQERAAAISLDSF